MGNIFILPHNHLYGLGLYIVCLVLICKELDNANNDLY
jgi:hypothetical protein